MADINAYKEGSPEWYKQLLDYLSRSTYDLIVQRQSEDKIMGQLNDSYQLLLNLRSDFLFRKHEPIRKSAMVQSNYLRSLAEYVVSQTGNAELDKLIWKYRPLEAQSGCLDSYFLYLEKNRDPEKRFYEPRRQKFLRFGLVQSMESLIHGDLDILGIFLPPGTGKSTAGIFLLSGVMGWWPSEPNLASAHSGILTRSFYDGVSQILTDTDEYAWHEIFPDVRFDPRYGTNSKEQTIDVGNMKRFKSLTCRAINASLTGATRAERLLYADDLCSGIEEALSKERMDKLWQTYNTDLKTRKKQFCKEIHVQTRWSVHDVAGRIITENADNPRAKFISVPALNEKGESNFEYDYGVGFSTQYFVDMRNSMDDVSFKCLFMNEPIEREGLLYHEDELRRYLDLPLQKPDAIRCIVDTKNKGTDYFFQPVFYVYGEDHYLVDCICSDESNYEVQYERSAQLLLSWKVEAARFESNNGGDRVSFEVDKRIKAAKGYCNITQAYTEQNKETKIILYAPWVKQHVIFKDKSMYDPKSPYGVMMSFLMSYTVAGKNKHDDVPDGLASYAKWIARPEAKPSTIIMSPF